MEKIGSDDTIEEIFWMRSKTSAAFFSLLVLGAGALILYQQTKTSGVDLSPQAQASLIYVLLGIVVIGAFYDIWMNRKNRSVHLAYFILFSVVIIGVVLWIQGSDSGSGLAYTQAGISLVDVVVFVLGILYVKRSKDRVNRFATNTIADHNMNTDQQDRWFFTNDFVMERRRNMYVYYSVLLVLLQWTQLGIWSADYWTVDGLNWGYYYKNTPLYAYLLVEAWLSILDSLPPIGRAEIQRQKSRRLMHLVDVVWWLMILVGTITFTYGRRSAMFSVMVTGAVILYITLVTFTIHYYMIICNSLIQKDKRTEYNKTVYAT